MGNALGVAGQWLPVRDGDPRALALYLRHYSAEKNRRGAVGPLGAAQRMFGGNGQRQAYLTVDATAAWNWRLVVGQGVVCSLFRNEGRAVCSDLIREADELAWARWPAERRHFTYVNPKAVRGTMVRGRPVYGWVFRKAGWWECGTTERGLLILEKLRVQP